MAMLLSLEQGCFYHVFVERRLERSHVVISLCALFFKVSRYKPTPQKVHRPHINMPIMHDDPNVCVKVPPNMKELQHAQCLADPKTIRLQCPMCGNPATSPQSAPKFHCIPISYPYLRLEFAFAEKNKRFKSGILVATFIKNTFYLIQALIQICL